MPLLAGFYTLDPDAILAANRALADAAHPARARVVSDAAVPFAPGMRAPVRGLWSEAYFGPVDARDPDAWGVIELSGAVLHPGLVGRVAGLLGFTPEEVLAVARARARLDGGAVLVDEDTEGSTLPSTEEGAGIDALFAALQDRVGGEAADYAIRRVPVPPVTMRPLERRPGGYAVAGSRSVALAHLFERDRRLARLQELNAPLVILRHEHAALQSLFDAALAPWTAAPREPERFEGSLEPAQPVEVPTWPVPETHRELVTVRGVAFAAPGRVLVDFATATFVIDLGTGAILDRWPSNGLRLVGCAGRHALYSAEDTWRFACFDLEARAWVRGELPDNVPFVFVEILETSYVVEGNTRRMHVLGEVFDYPTEMRVSACGRYLYATDKHGNAGIYRYDGELQFPLDQGGVVPADPPDVLVVPPGPRSDSEEDEVDYGLLAFGIRADRDTWLRVDGGALLEGGDVRVRFGDAVESACFDHDGANALAVVDGRLYHLAIGDTPRIEAALDLRPLHGLFLGDGPPRNRPRPDALNAVLSRHGTLADARHLDTDALAALNVACTYDMPKRLGRARARRIAELIGEVGERTAVPCSRLL